MALFGKKNDNNDILPEDSFTPEEKAPDAGEKAEFNFNRYFLAERRISLDNISFETQRPAAGSGKYQLGVKDTIVAQVMGQAGVKITYNRTLRFDPEGPFTLSVSYGVMLVFNPGTRDEVNWREIDVAAEFRKNCPQLCAAMSAKAALLVAEITNEATGNPVIPVKM
ncbi:MAG: hypothetical protein J6L96_10490 [Clostridia bacterium]|nr:hypothetical protein [Clostridia bacterium]